LKKSPELPSFLISEGRTNCKKRDFVTEKELELIEKGRGDI